MLQPHHGGANGDKGNAHDTEELSPSRMSTTTGNSIPSHPKKFRKPLPESAPAPLPTHTRSRVRAHTHTHKSTHTHASHTCSNTHAHQSCQLHSHTRAHRRSHAHSPASPWPLRHSAACECTALGSPPGFPRGCSARRGRSTRWRDLWNAWQRMGRRRLVLPWLSYLWQK